MSYQKVYEALNGGLKKEAMKKQAVNELLQLIYRTSKKHPILSPVKKMMDRAAEQQDKGESKPKQEKPVKANPNPNMAKKASSEQLKKLASVIGMRKKAA